jgi:hypothetical protein
MIWHMRSISIRIRNIVSGFDTLIHLLLNIGLGELDEFFTLCVHHGVVLVTIFVSNSTLDMWPSCIQRRHSLHIPFFHPSPFELDSLLVERQSLVWFFPSQSSSPYCYSYFEEVTLYLASLTCSLQVQAS